MLFCEKCKNVYTIVKTVGDEKEDGHLLCDTCGHHKRIENTTLLYQTRRTSITKEQLSEEDVALKKHDLYQHKMIQECSNKQCASHKNREKGVDVVMIRNEKFDILYVCMTCNQKQTIIPV